MKNPIFDLIEKNKLTPDEVVFRFKQLKTAKSEAMTTKLKNEILLANLGLVVSGCKRFFSYKGLDSDDLIEEGICGLHTAIDKFDVDKGYKFSTYAFWWIKQRVRRYLEAQNMDPVRAKSMSIDCQVEDSKKTFVDMLIAPKSAIENNDSIDIIKKIADEVLTPRERLILNLRYNI